MPVSMEGESALCGKRIGAIRPPEVKVPERRKESGSHEGENGPFQSRKNSGGLRGLDNNAAKASRECLEVESLVEKTLALELITWGGSTKKCPQRGIPSPAKRPQQGRKRQMA